MKIAPLLLLLFLSTLSIACSSTRAPEPIVVRVFRDRDAIDINMAIFAAGQGQLRTSRGRPIVIATLETKTYAESLKTLGTQTRCELVIFNSAEDGERAKIEVPPQSLIEVGAKRYCLVVPSWVTGEEQEATQLVLNELREELAKNVKARPQ